VSATVTVTVDDLAARVAKLEQQVAELLAARPRTSFARTEFDAEDDPPHVPYLPLSAPLPQGPLERT